MAVQPADWALDSTLSVLDIARQGRPVTPFQGERRTLDKPHQSEDTNNSYEGRSAQPVNLLSLILESLEHLTAPVRELSLVQTDIGQDHNPLHTQLNWIGCRCSAGCTMPAANLTSIGGLL